jgi:hypothetical protein
MNEKTVLKKTKFGSQNCLYVFCKQQTYRILRKDGATWFQKLVPIFGKGSAELEKRYLFSSFFEP